MTMAQTLKKELEEISNERILWDCPLAPYTSFGIGGPADALIEVQSVAGLETLLRFFEDRDLPWRFIGRGSNLLVADSGFAGAVLFFAKEMSTITMLERSATGGIRVRVGAGCSLARLMNWCMDHDCSGLEFTAGIPGSIGGAALMNAGAWGEDMAGIIEAMEVFSVSKGVEKLHRDQLDFDYRVWRNQGSGDAQRIVTSVDLILRRGEKKHIRTRCRENLARRKKKQPKFEKNAGSFFKNPENDSAGRLIEASGLKGTRCGGAMVSPVHANFLVNTGNATAEDVHRLMDKVTRKVAEDSGIQLSPEVHFL